MPGGKPQTVIVITKALVGAARADITLEGNQGDVTSDTFQVKTADKTRHVFKTLNIKAVEDIRLIVNYANGNTTNACPIRRIEVLGNFIER